MTNMQTHYLFSQKAVNAKESLHRKEQGIK